MGTQVLTTLGIHARVPPPRALSADRALIQRHEIRNKGWISVHNTQPAGGRSVGAFSQLLLHNGRYAARPPHRDGSMSKQLCCPPGQAATFFGARTCFASN